MRVKVRLEHILNKAKKSQPEAMSHKGYDAMGGGCLWPFWVRNLQGHEEMST